MLVNLILENIPMLRMEMSKNMREKRLASKGKYESEHSSALDVLSSFVVTNGQQINFIMTKFWIHLVVT